MHGGTRSSFPQTRLIRGLSPHARGNRCKRANRTKRRRSIPACTGEPGLRPMLALPDRVYPRMHGGTMTTISIFLSSSGLSPHARGNPVARSLRTSALGSIPACTGEPNPQSRTDLCTGVYPRMHGGTFGAALMSEYFLGLSPHARGNRGRQH